MESSPPPVALAFPADSAAVELIRTNSTGHKSKMIANLDAINSGTDADLAIARGRCGRRFSVEPEAIRLGILSLLHHGG